MDTLKEVTPSRFSTLPTLCWTEKGILTSPHIISTLSCFSIWGGCFFPTLQFLLLAIQRENVVCYRQRNEPSTVLLHFFQTFFFSRQIRWFEHFRCCSVSCQSHIWLYIVVGWTSRVVLWLVSRCFSQRAWAQFSLTAKIHPAEVPGLQQDMEFLLKRRSSNTTLSSIIVPPCRPIKDTDGLLCNMRIISLLWMM